MKEEKKFSGFAITGFVLSFFPFLFVSSILAIIFSAAGLRQIQRGEREGKGLAIAGLVMGIIGTVISVLSFAAMMTMLTSF